MPVVSEIGNVRSKTFLRWYMLCMPHTNCHDAPLSLVSKDLGTRDFTSLL